MSKFHKVSHGHACEIFDVPRVVRIDCGADPEFTRKYGQKVKAAGGKYTECRGHAGKRYVTVPTEGNEALISAIAEDFGRFDREFGGPTPTVTMVSEQIAEGYGGFQAWIAVHQIEREGEGTIFDRFVAAHEAALMQAVKRGVDGVRVGSVPQSYHDYVKAQEAARAAREALPKAEAALVEAALAFGRGDADMGLLGNAIAECANARTHRDATHGAWKAAEADFEAEVKGAAA